MSHKNVRSACIDRAGNVWVATFGGGLNKFEPTTGRWTRFAADYQRTSGFPKQTIHSLNLWQIVCDAEGKLWLCSRDRGVALFDPERESVEKLYCHDPRNSTSLSNNDVWTVHEHMQQGTPHTRYIWIATFGGGLNRLDKVTGACTVYRSEAYNSTTLPTNYILALYTDKQNVLWVGTQLGGVSRLDPRAQQFRSLQSSALPNKPFSLSHAVIRAVFEDSRGRLWVGTNVGGLNLVERPSGNVRVWKHDSLKSNTLSGNAVWGITEDDSGLLWLATSNGVTALDGTTLSVKHVYRHDPNNPRSLGSNTVRVVYYDSRKRLWVGGFQGGLHRWIPRTMDFTRYEYSPAVAHSISTDEVRAICEDVSDGVFNGRLWVGTWGGGVNYFNPETEVFTAYRYNANDPTSLSNDVVRCIYVDSKDRVWVGTNDGLNLFDRRTKRWQRFYEADGLPNNVVYAIREDSEGALWLSTNKGLARFFPEGLSKHKRIQCFTMVDGLPADEFNGNVSWRGRDGTLYFGSIAGLVMAHPALLQRDSALLNVVLTGYKVFNTPVALDTVIEERSALEVSYAEKMITFEFAALTSSLAESVQYRYTLEGFDTTWVYSSSHREATYTNLDPDVYTFRVQARFPNGGWGASSKDLTLRILPPWWMTWWFRVSAAIGVAMIVWGAYRARVAFFRKQNQRLEQEVAKRTEELSEANVEIQRQLMIQAEQARDIEVANTMLQERNEELQALYNENNEIIGIVAHDLKNPINGIMGITDLLLSEDGMPDKEQRHLLEVIRTSSNQMMALITNLLDANRIERTGIPVQLVSVPVQLFAESVVEDYQSRASAKNIRLHLDSLAQDYRVVADEALLRQVLDNLVSNAIKYSPHGKNVWVKIKVSSAAANSSSNNLVRIEVQDEGPGISAEDQKKLFGKFARLSAQPTGGEHSTGLGLNIVKRLVEAMNGRVWCESELGKGATFIVELPASM